jgi:hypothetical protein
MKKIKSIIAFLLLASIMSAQDEVCITRGHVSNGSGTSTTAGCDPLITDYPDSTVVHYDWCNIESYKCIRCKKTIKKNGYKIVAWRRPVKSGLAPYSLDKIEKP